MLEFIHYLELTLLALEWGIDNSNVTSNTITLPLSYSNTYQAFVCSDSNLEPTAVSSNEYEYSKFKYVQDKNHWLKWRTLGYCVGKFKIKYC